MSKYTSELRYFLESGLLLFDFDYDVPPSDKERLEHNIITYYYFYEIGSETWHRFKINFQNTMQTNMQYFNKLYIGFNNFDPNTDYNMTSSSLGNIISNSKNIFNDTPASELQNLNYATNISTADTNTNTNNTSNVKGFKSNMIDKLIKLKLNPVNIDNLVINSLADCFMLVF